MRVRIVYILAIACITGCAPYNHHFYDIDIPGRELSNRCGIPESSLFSYQGLYIRIEVNAAHTPTNLGLTVYVPEGKDVKFLSDSVSIQEPLKSPPLEKLHHLRPRDESSTGLHDSTSTMKGKSVVRKSIFGDVTHHMPYRFDLQPAFVAHEENGAITLPSMEIDKVRYPPVVIPYRAASKFVFASLNGC